jgi:thiol-disulfide isomerase/thioredoxin
MAQLESLDIPLGTKMPKFILRDPNGVIQVSDYAFGKKGLLIVFTCNHCPYAKAVWPRIIRIGTFAQNNGVNVLAINPNINPDYPDDSPDEMRNKIKEWGIPFPYLIDNTQKTAQEFKAQCTPDIYLFNAVQKLVYHGRVDDNWQDESKVTKEELKEAIEKLVAGKLLTEVQFPSIGCSVKWKE